MRKASNALAFTSLRTFCGNYCYKGRSLATVQLQLRGYANERAEDSSTSNWGTGEPPIDEKHTQRGVSRGETSGMNQNTSKGETAEVGRHDETTSTSKFDSGASSSPAAAPASESRGETKKSRTGGDMNDDGQVKTPHLGKMRTTRDMIHDKGKETEERLSHPDSKST
ncbi:hypothetical protein Mapa_008864 [Marchantia paleacea]|nr:hypothetical protein Mapa_008864 [Marchantia paleacea]